MDFYLYMGLEVILKVGLLIVPRTPRRGDCGTMMYPRLSTWLVPGSYSWRIEGLGFGTISGP